MVFVVYLPVAPDQLPMEFYQPDPPARIASPYLDLPRSATFSDDTESFFIICIDAMNTPSISVTFLQGNKKRGENHPFLLPIIRLRFSAAHTFTKPLYGVQLSHCLGQLGLRFCIINVAFAVFQRLLGPRFRLKRRSLIQILGPHSSV